MVAADHSSHHPVQVDAVVGKDHSRGGQRSPHYAASCERCCRASNRQRHDYQSLGCGSLPPLSECDPHRIPPYCGIQCRKLLHGDTAGDGGRKSRKYWCEFRLQQRNVRAAQRDGRRREIVYSVGGKLWCVACDDLAEPQRHRRPAESAATHAFQFCLHYRPRLPLDLATPANACRSFQQHTIVQTQ